MALWTIYRLEIAVRYLHVMEDRGHSPRAFIHVDTKTKVSNLFRHTISMILINQIIRFLYMSCDLVVAHFSLVLGFIQLDQGSHGIWSMGWRCTPRVGGGVCG